MDNSKYKLVPLKNLLSIIFLLIFISGCTISIKYDKNNYIQGADAYNNRGNVKYDKGDYDGAIADYNKAIELNPDFTDAYNNRGNAKEKKGDYDGSIADHNKAIELKPDYAHAYYNRGNAKYEKGDYDGSIADYNKAIELKPDFTDAYNNRGNTKEKKGDYDGAITDYNIAIKLAPDYANAYSNRGVAKYKKGDYDGAIADYNKAIELKPDYASAYNNQGVVKYDKGDYDGSIADHNKAIELKPDFTDAYNNRGNTKEKKGDYDGAIEDYNKAIELKPDYANAYSNRGNVKYDKGDYDGSIADHSKAIELKLDYALAYSNRGNAKKSKGDYDGAISDHNKAIELKPDYASAYNNRGVAKYYKGDYDGAIADYNKAIELKPDYADPFNNRGGAKYCKGDYDGAIMDYNKAIELKPDYVYAYNNRGRSYEKMRYFEYAIEDYRKALSYGQNFHNAKNNLNNLFTVLNGNTEFTKKIQMMLSKLSYYNKTIDGIWGDNTRKAIAQFQKDNQLKQTGEIDNESHRLLVQTYEHAIQEVVFNSPQRNKILINSPVNGYETSENSVYLDAILSSEMQIDRIVIKVNDQNFKSSNEPDYNSTRTSANIDWTIPLSEGRNEINIVAFNSKGGVVKKKLTVIHNKPNIEKTIGAGEKWAVVIGIEDYQDNKIPDLDFSVDDAEGFTKILIEKGEFLPNHIYLLTDKEEKTFKGVIRQKPTRSNLMKTLFTTLRNKTSAKDSVIIYYSGHGVFVPDPTSSDGRTAYLVPQDFEYDAPEVNGIKLEEIKRLSYLSPERMFLIIDSCFSGSGGRNIKTVSLGGMKAVPGNVTGGFTGKGRVLMVSSLDNQVSIEAEQFRRSVFTYYLVDILSSGEKRLSEIFDYVHKNVRLFTNGNQEPRLDSFEQKGQILLY